MKILYVSTISNTINAFLIPHIKMLIEEGYQVDIACNIKREINEEIENLNCRVYNVEFQRSPFNRKNLTAYKKLKKIIKKGGYDIVHTHTPVASTLTRLACKNNNNIKVIYTAHGFHFFKGASLLNWLVYYPIERYLSRFTDVLITINREDYNRAKNSFKAKKIEYLPGVGLDTKKIKNLHVDKAYKRQEIGIPSNAFLMLSVGELNKNKNHETIIRAVAELENSNVFYIICGEGELKEPLKKLIKDLSLDNQVKLLGFRKDIYEICKVADVFIFPSFREGLSVALMEAMTAGLPVICSNIRGNVDLVEDEVGGYLLSPNDVKGFSLKMSKLIVDDRLRKEMSLTNIKTIQDFDIENIKKRLLNLY